MGIEETEQAWLDRIDGGQLAFSLALRDMAVALFPDEGVRAEHGDLICKAIEATYGEIGVSRHAHGPFQVAMAAIEGIYAPLLGAQPKSDPPTMP